MATSNQRADRRLWQIVQRVEHTNQSQLEKRQHDKEAEWPRQTSNIDKSMAYSRQEWLLRLLTLTDGAIAC
jgi:hypothetical protein